MIYRLTLIHFLKIDKWKNVNLMEIEK